MHSFTGADDPDYISIIGMRHQNDSTLLRQSNDNDKMIRLAALWVN